MQNQEWNNLYNGDPAKWAKMDKLFITEDKQEEKELIREEIEKNEEEIPVELTTEMHLFIKSLQDKGLSKRNIRRAFERKFNVKIV